MLRRDLLKLISSFLAGSVAASHIEEPIGVNCGDYTIPNCGLPQSNILYGGPTLLMEVKNDKKVSMGDELYIDDKGRMTKDLRFKADHPQYRFFALSNSSEDNTCTVILKNNYDS